MKFAYSLELMSCILILDICLNSVHGDCQHNRRRYLKQMVWQPGPCAVCRCLDPIVSCDTIRCTDPLCAYDKGEYLQISADSCCPECVSQPASCIYQDQNISHNTEWNPEPYVKCGCSNGEVKCTELPCPSTMCKPGEIIQNLPGHRCPLCIPAGRSCSYNGETHLDGSNWQILSHVKCLCSDGHHSCYPIYCPPVVCAENEVLETPAGMPCPECHGLDMTCRQGSVEYRTGEQWNQDNCTLCVCISGTVVCTVKECVDHLICGITEVQVTRPGECCPECVPASGVCKDLKLVQYSGDTWNISNCEYCICREGKVQCHTAVCESVVCLKDEALVHLPGTCCPQCVISPSCELSDKTHRDGEIWMADECTMCFCDSGTTQCYKQHCPVCPVGTRSTPVAGECCGTCQKIDCSPQCSDCELTAHQNCTVCTNTQLYVQDGLCLHTCRMGFYPSPSGVCRPCHESCYTCVEGSQYHCDMCQPGLMWKHGECVTQCGPGYYLQNGRCKECVSSCKSCNGASKSQCISCTNIAQVIFQGECLDNCPENFYIRSGQCIACHSTCKTCTPDGSGCASCWQGGLLHQGQCVVRCPAGYYPNLDGSCSSCHPACETCDGGHSKNCTSCPVGFRIAKNGKCRSLCENKGKYLSVDGTCKDCEGVCAECHEAWNGGSTICSVCNDKDLIPSGSGCVEKCKSEQYQEFRVCKDCGENCQTCSSPTACTRCTSNMLIYKGLCVEYCAQSQYEDGSTLSCKDCSMNCLTCYSEEDCSICDSMTFLKDGYCVDTCGSGYMPNMNTKECQKNVEAPIFKVLQHVKVQNGEITDLDVSLFYISDHNTKVEDLFLLLISTPNNGNLLMSTEGKDVILKAGDNFTVDYMIKRRIRFKHTAGNTMKGKAVLQVSDTQLTSPNGDLYFQAIMPSAISILKKSLLIAAEKEVTLIQPEVLDFVTVQTDVAKVKVIVLQGPKEGSIYNTHLKLPVRVFTLWDLRHGTIGYQHSSQGRVGADGALFQISDGFHLLTCMFDIEVTAKGNLGPVLMHNTVGHVVLGGMLQISPDLLLAMVVNSNGSRDEVVYSLIPPLNNPQEGEIIMIVPIPPSGVSHGWDDLGDGNMVTRLTRFLQRDINEGRIWYKNKGNSPLTDVIRFEVADINATGSVLTDQSLTITVREKSNPGPRTQPTLADGIHLGIRVPENQLVSITSASLLFEDGDTAVDGILYFITQSLSPNDGTLEHVERPTQALNSFTQDDINNNRVVYRPPNQEIGYKEKEVYFSFTVSDGKTDVSLQEHKFSIIIMPVNNKPPRFISPIHVMNVSQGGSILLGQHVLGVTDEDTPEEFLAMTLTRSPHHGQLEKVMMGLKTSLRQGDNFTYQELHQNTYQYQHDGSANLADTLQLTVSDGEHIVPSTIDFTVLKIDLASPYVLSSALCRLVVSEGTTRTISRDIIAFGDDDPDDSLTITLKTETVYGRLLLNSQQVMSGNTFKQTDINNLKLSFLADSEIGPKAVSEILTFSVTDSSGNVLPLQTLTVQIEPYNNLPPQLKFTPQGVRVKEGGKVTLTFDDLQVLDQDTAIHDLVIGIDSQPRFGVIQDNAPVDGAEQMVDGSVTSFPVEDLLNGYITYMQSDHKNKEPVRDSLLLYAFDAKNKSPIREFNISVELVNDEAPKIMTEQVFVQEGHKVTISNSSVYITDLDTPAEKLLLTVDIAPQHGEIRKQIDRKQAISEAVVMEKDLSFSYKDVLEELLFYVHDGSEVTMDSFSLHITDGQFSVTGRVPIIIGSWNNDTPRVTVNRGLRIYSGTSVVITSHDLKYVAVDTDDTQLIYTLTKDTRIGSLYLTTMDRQISVTSKGPVSSFTQTDINNGNLLYKHSQGKATGMTKFTFSVSDLAGNDILEQEFFITILEDRSPPIELANQELKVQEGGKLTITTDYLSFMDIDSETASLLYTVIEPPQFGHLELTRNPGVPILEFSQAALTGNNLIYLHTSTSEEHVDSFTFSVSDGTNEVLQTAVVIISPVDDSIPEVTIRSLKAQQRVRKLISEYDLKAVDNDTKEDSLIFTIIQPVQHGAIQHLSNSYWKTTTTFSMAEIYENHISYLHDGGETTQDSFTFSLSDGNNNRFTVLHHDGKSQHTILLTETQKFLIEIIPMDNGSPIIQVNRGLKFLDILSSGVGNIITHQELKAVDEETTPNKLKFVVRSAPLHGKIEKTTNPGVDIFSFTQEDIDNAIVRYILTKQGTFYSDGFTFDLYDSRPNRVPGNEFHITWSSVSFERVSINISETARIIQVPIKRSGNLKQHSVVTCHTLSGTATANEELGTKPGQQDFIQFKGQVQFDEWQDRKTCTIIINDDSIFEGPESFSVELIEPMFTLLGTVPKMTVNIVDSEDEPILQFLKSKYQVNESASYLSAAMVRTGDISSTVSTICYTTSITARGSPLDRLESGSDYISRGNSNSYRVIFPSGITTATCDIKLIDDNMNEVSEMFQLELSLPSYGAKLGPVSQAIAIIMGPNDESTIHFSQTTYNFRENSGTVDIDIAREGSDLSHTTTVWCATRLSMPPSASSGQDYVPSASQITFSPGQTLQKCQVTILDELVDPKVEGNETFTVFLSSSINSNLGQPYTAVVIVMDTELDMPVMSFEADKYCVDESSKAVNVPITRSGDTTYESSVICYTGQSSAQAMMDFHERQLTEDSRIIFKPGEKVKNCTVQINDDEIYQDDKVFYVYLTHPLGNNGNKTKLGDRNSTTITVTNNNDVPRIQFEKSAYSVSKPNAEEQVAMVTIRVIRSGDVSKVATVRCSTRDGSAMSGTDYQSKSQVLEFDKDVSSINFTIDILYNSDIEWHEMFTVLLGPGDPVGAELGPVATAAITILDNDVSGSLILPAAPVVVSLLKYDDVPGGERIDPSPGYPLICITPCSERHPSYSVTRVMCKDAKINQSAIFYRWEIAIPDVTGSRPPFVEISYNTLFSSVNHIVLDSVYFRPSFLVRCVAQPVDENGNPGIPLKSSPVTIGRDNGICKAPIFSGLPYSYQAQSFHAKLDYVGTDDPLHPNTIHISVQVPHQDGMLPLISTFPIYNLKYSLLDLMYRKQHVCSNIIMPEELAPSLKSGFLNNTASYPRSTTPGFDYPYQMDSSLREKKTLMLYKYLNLKTCLWSFDAWYHMTDLVDLCGGHAVADFQVKDGGQTYLTIRMPLHMSYLYTVVLQGWGSLEHRTMLEFSFYYNTVLWHSGVETEIHHGGRLQVMRILIGDDGRLVIDFKTQAKFRGLYVLEHNTLPDYKSQLMSKDKIISFHLDLVWGQNTFDGPHQLWRATSEFSLKDYTGEYIVELIACTVQPYQAYTMQTPAPCTAHKPQRFEIPVAFQQTNRPVPLVYTLNTHFQLTNNEKVFLSNPFQSHFDINDTELDSFVTFSKGDTIYGRVLWSPEQDLKDAYRLMLEKVFICAGSNGFIPTYDPTGTVYNNGPQFGCIQPLKNLKYRFHILDRGAPEITTKQFQDVEFKAKFISDNFFLSLFSMNGVDGFMFSVDPLYQMSGFQWYIQVIYSIGPSDSNLLQYHEKRSALFSLDKRKRSVAQNVDGYSDWLENNISKNGTTIKVLHLNNTQVYSSLDKKLTVAIATVILPVLFAVILIVCILLTGIICVKQKRKRHKKQSHTKRNNLELTQHNSVIYKGHQNYAVRCSSGLKHKETIVYKGDHGRSPVRVKDTNVQTDKNISKGNGTEV